MSTPTILPAIPARRTAQHPLFAAAAVSVIVLSATGVASMTGLIGRPAAQPVALAPQPATPPWIEAPRPVAQAEDPRSWATVESVRTVRTGGDANGRGAVGGGLLGHQVEQRVRGEVRHEAVVRLDDGSTRTFVREAAWPMQPGERVRVMDGRLVDAEAAAPATRQVRYGSPSGG
jgi:hypothetical protein